MTLVKFRAKLNQLIHETLQANKHDRNAGSAVELELAQQCSLTTLRMVVAEKEKRIEEKFHGKN